jgi:hypothetical protein
MANEEHLRILMQGVGTWNSWRVGNPKKRPILDVADLRDMDLTGVNFNGAYLKLANLNNANLSYANLSYAALSNANLISAKLYEASLANANLYHADFTDADLRGTDFNNADLIWTHLTRVNLVGTSLRGVHLRFVDLVDANLTDADFSQVIMGGARFGNNDLSVVKGLDTVIHRGPSNIDIDTIYRSKGNIPEVFLRGAGVPENFLTYMASLTGKAFEFYSCFISYSSKDQSFAERLHADLQNKGVRCWFAPEDLKIGEKIRVGIDESIRKHDKLLLVLSQDSVESEWVEQEVETALSKERNEKRLVLFPIRLDDSVMNIGSGWPALIRNTRHIGDFKGWKDHDTYLRAFDRLIRDLKAEELSQGRT